MSRAFIKATIISSFLFAAVVAPTTATKAATLPDGWSCTGGCGTASGSDGVVAAPPSGNANYNWVSTDGGVAGVGGLGVGNETNGSLLETRAFSVASDTKLKFSFNYVTSDGSGYEDYAWAGLKNLATGAVSLLFTARTEPSGSIVPGLGLPATAPGVTLNPASVEIVPGAPVWSPLGVDSTGTCWDLGCGFTGWVNSTYTIPDAGQYSLLAGVTNLNDTIYNSGLAIDGVVAGNEDISPVPLPGSIGMFSAALLGLVGLGLKSRRTIIA